MNLGNDSIVSVYSDARTEYTKQLCVFLVPAYFRFFIDLLDKSKELTLAEPKKSLWQFQTFLNEIHDWNMEKVNHEINTIYNNCGCDYLEDLLTAVFIAHTKVLTAIRLNSSNKKINITVPKVEHFLFKVLCECSRLLWSSTFLFRDGVSSIEKQQNYRNIEQILNEGILQAVRSLVPVKSILKDFVKSDDMDNNHNDHNDSDDEDDCEKDHKKEESRSNINNIEECSNNEIDTHNIVENVIENNTENNTGKLFENSVENSGLEINNIENNTSEENLIEQEINTIHTPEVISTEDETISNETSNNITNTIVNPIINIEERPVVQFTDFDAVFDSDNPFDSEMVFDPKDQEADDSDESPGLEILDTQGAPIADDFDFDTLDNNENTSITDYDVLV